MIVALRKFRGQAELALWENRTTLKFKGGFALTTIFYRCPRSCGANRHCAIFSMPWMNSANKLVTGSPV
jgi:hypothetical protein